MADSPLNSSAVEMLASQYERLGRKYWAEMVRSGVMPSVHDEVAILAITEALQLEPAIKPDTFFVIDCPGYPGGIDVYPNTFEYAMEFISKHGNDKTKLATWRNQYMRIDYSPERVQAFVDDFLKVKAELAEQQSV